MTIDISSKLQELARARPGRPVISVYLDTRWSDEHQRERVRVFLKNHVRETTRGMRGELDAELAWITAEGDRLVKQELDPDAAGAALVAGGVDNLRELLRFAVPFSDTFLVADRPQLRPLVTALGVAPRAALLFVDAESARVVALTETGPAEEAVLQNSDAVGQHRRGGWLLLLQSRYQRHIHVHRARHFDAVADALVALVQQYGLRALVLAGETRNLAVFRTHLPPWLADRIVGEVAAARYEPTSVLATRAVAVLQQRSAGHLAVTVDALLADAAGGGRAVAGPDATIDAVNRGTVDRLYLLTAYAGTGAECRACEAVDASDTGRCAWCDQATRPADLGETLVRRVLAAGGDVATVDVHAALERAGGVAALLRYR
jgi:hypothetical protein